MIKRIAAILVVWTLLIGLCACGQGTSGQSMSGPVGSVDLTTWQEQYDLGLRFLSEGNYEEAIIAFTAAIEIDPKQALAYVGRGNAYIGLGETEENLTVAKADYETAIELDEINAAAYLGLADVYIRWGDYDKALKVLQIGLEKIGGDQSLADKIAEMERGNIVDSFGNLRKEVTYDGNGTVLYYFEYGYNANSQIKTIASYDGVGTQTGYAECTYDAEGRNIKSYYKHYKDNIAATNPLTYTFNDLGQEVRSDWYWWNDGSLHQYTETDYDQNGDKIEWRIFKPDGTITQKSVWKYSSKGIMSKEVCYHFYENGSADYSITTYSDIGNPVEQVNYNADGKITGRWVYEYDENGREISNSYFDSEGNLNTKTVIEYGLNGQMLSRTQFDKNGNVMQATKYST